MKKFNVRLMRETVMYADYEIQAESLEKAQELAEEKLNNDVDSLTGEDLSLDWYEGDAPNVYAVCEVWSDEDADT